MIDWDYERSRCWFPTPPEELPRSKDGAMECPTCRARYLTKWEFGEHLRACGKGLRTADEETRVDEQQACAPSEMASMLADNVNLVMEVKRLRSALRVIQKGLTEDSDGEFWPARSWLDKRDIYHGDLSGYRVLDVVAKSALSPLAREAGCADAVPTCADGEHKELIALRHSLAVHQEIAQQVAALPSIVPSELSGEEAWNRNGEYISRHSVLKLLSRLDPPVSQEK